MRPAVFIDVPPPRYLTSLSEARQALVGLPTLSMVPTSPAGPSILAVGSGGQIIHRATRWPMTEQAFHLLATAVDRRMASLAIDIGSPAGSVDVFNAYARYRKHAFHGLVLLVGGGAVRGATRRQKSWRPALQAFDSMLAAVDNVLPSWSLVRAILWSRSYNLVFAAPKPRPEDDCRIGVAVSYDDAVGSAGVVRPVLVHRRFGVLSRYKAMHQLSEAKNLGSYELRIAQAVERALPALRHTEATLSRSYLPAPGVGAKQISSGPLQVLLWHDGTRELQLITRDKTFRAFEMCWSSGRTDVASFLDTLLDIHRRSIPSVRTLIEAVVYDIVSRDIRWLDAPATWSRVGHGKTTQCESKESDRAGAQAQEVGGPG